MRRRETRIKLTRGRSAVVFEPDGRVKIFVPKHWRDTDEAPPHVILATAVAYLACTDPGWVEATMDRILEKKKP